MKEFAVIVIGFLDDPAVCDRLTVYVPFPPAPVPNAVIKVPDAIVVPDDRKSYTARDAGFAVPGNVQEEVIVSVVFEIYPLQLATAVVVDASLTSSVE